MIYVQCKACFRLNEEGLDRCAECGNLLRRSAPIAPAVHMFPAGWWEHLDREPIYIKNRKQLLEVCAQKGVRANILD